MNANPSQSRERKPAILKFVFASFIIKCGMGMCGKQYLVFYWILLFFGYCIIGKYK